MPDNPTGDANALKGTNIMQIQAHGNAASLIEIYRAKAAAGGQQGGRAAEAKTGDAATANSPGAVTGAGSSSLLSSDSLGRVLAEGQHVGAGSGVALPAATKGMLEQIAHDPAFAADQAALLARGTRAVFMVPPAHGAPEHEIQAFNAKMSEALGALDAAQQQKLALYDGETAKGTPPAEIYAKMLQLELSQSQGYWDAQDPTHQLGDLRSGIQAQLAHLQQSMAVHRA